MQSMEGKNASPSTVGMTWIQYIFFPFIYNGLAQYCGNSFANALDLAQSHTNPWTLFPAFTLTCRQVHLPHYHTGRILTLRGLFISYLADILAHCLHVRAHPSSWALFKYKDHLSRYGDSHDKDKTVVTPPYLYCGNPHTWKDNICYCHL